MFWWVPVGVGVGCVAGVAGRVGVGLVAARARRVAQLVLGLADGGEAAAGLLELLLYAENFGSGDTYIYVYIYLRHYYSFY